MTKASALPYYPRFIFSCSDGKSFSTADANFLKYVKDADDEYEHDITQFVPGQVVNISWAAANDEVEIKSYEVDRIEIHQIKYDLDQPTTGMNSNDSTSISGNEKKHMMEIYVFLNSVK